MVNQKTIELKLRLDERNASRAAHFFAHYALETMLGDTEKKHYLGDKDPRSCRFCKKSKPDVTFRALAHVMPQFMGNRNLLSYFECDICNALFGTYEDSFANFNGISRTFTQIKGRSNKVPKYKDNKSGLEVFVDDTGIQITTIEGMEVCTIDEETNTLVVTTERPAYTPIHIPKVIIKMGLSLLSQADMDDYEFARSFILGTDGDARLAGSDHLNLFRYFIPGPTFYQKPFIQLYRKHRDVSEQIPSRIVVLYHSNYCYQMVLPFAESEKHFQGVKLNVPILPLLIDYPHFERYGLYQEQFMNLSSSERRVGEEHVLSFSFDSVQKTTY